MAFCKFSSQLCFDNKISLDNAFLNEFLPHASGECVKVYLYGLYKCYDSASADNNLENFAKILNMNTEDVIGAFKFWEEQGLVQIINIEPLEIRYLPVQNNFKNMKKYNKDKYRDFNTSVQNIIEGRMITPNEYAEYYSLIESFHMEPEALLMIVKYCVLNKESNVGWKYICTIAKNWAYEGILNTTAVEKKLNELEKTSGNILEVLHALKSKRSATIDEFQKFLKWQKDYGFEKETIIYVAKNLKNKTSFEKLDQKLTKYYENKLLSTQEITNYETNKNKLFDLAKNVCKAIGVYYENLEAVIETYILHWQDMGYDESTIQTIANYCFKNNLRTLSSVDSTLLKFHKLGLVSLDAINQYIEQTAQITNQVKQMLNALGLQRTVISSDFSFFNTFTNVWKFDLDIILYACELAKSKEMPMQYLNKILSSWHENKIENLEQAKKQTGNIIIKSTKTNQKIVGKSYSDEEIQNLFTNLDEVEI